VAVRGLMHLKLALVCGQFLFRLLQLECELCSRGAIACLEIGLRFGLELLHVRLVGRDLPGDAFDEAAVLFETDAALLELLDRAIVFVSHLCDWIGFPEDVRDFVSLGHERRPELVKNHGGSFKTTSYFLPGSRSPPTASARILP